MSLFRISENKRNIKRGFDTEKAKKNRQQFSLNIRKNHKDDRLTKRRFLKTESGVIENLTAQENDELSEKKEDVFGSFGLSFGSEKKFGFGLGSDIASTSSFGFGSDIGNGSSSKYSIKGDKGDKDNKGEDKSTTSSLQKQLRKYLFDLDSKEYEVVMSALHNIRLLTSEEGADRVFKQIVSMGILSRLVKFIDDFYSMISDERYLKLVDECVWIISNCCSSKLSITRQVVATNSLNLLAKLFMCGNEDICNSAIYGLGNIAADGIFWEQICEKLDLTQCLRRAETFRKIETMEKLTWFLSNLFTESKKIKRIGKASTPLPHTSESKDSFGSFSEKDGKSKQDEEEIKIHIPSRYLEHVKFFYMYCLTNCADNVQILENVLKVLKYVTNGKNEDEIELDEKEHSEEDDDLYTDNVIGTVLSMCLHQGILQRLCIGSNEKFQKTALHILGNLVRGRKSEYAIEILNPKYEILKMWAYLLANPNGTNKNVKRLIIWSVSNLAAENEVCLLEIFKTEGLIESIINIVRSGECDKCNNEFYHFVDNLCYLSLDPNINKYLMYLVEKDILKVLIQSLVKRKESVGVINKSPRNLKMVLLCVARFYELYESISRSSTYSTSISNWEKGKIIIKDFENSECWEIINSLRTCNNKKIAGLATSIMVNAEKIHKDIDNLESHSRTDTGTTHMGAIVGTGISSSINRDITAGVSADIRNISGGISRDVGTSTSTTTDPYSFAMGSSTEITTFPETSTTTSPINFGRDFNTGEKFNTMESKESDRKSAFDWSSSISVGMSSGSESKLEASPPLSISAFGTPEQKNESMTSYDLPSTWVTSSMENNSHFSSSLNQKPGAFNPWFT